MKRALRVALIYDDHAWILGYYARELQERINRRSETLRIDVHLAPQSPGQLRAIERSCDVVHFLSPWDFMPLHRALTTPVVVTYHHVVDGGWDIFDDHHARVDAICAVTPEWARAFGDRKGPHAGEIHLTPYGIDGTVFRPIGGGRAALLDRFGLGDDVLVLGFSGSKASNYMGRKSLERIFAVMSALRARHGDRGRLILFGRGWTIDDVPADLRSSVTIPGFLPFAELPALYNGLDYYLCLSSCEGGPYPVMECMACEVKVISTPVGVVPSLIRDGVNGFRVGHDDYLERVVRIIDEWNTDSEASRALRREARRSVLERHAWEKSADPALHEPIYRGAVRHWKTRSLPERLAPRLHHFGSSLLRRPVGTARQLVRRSARHLRNKDLG